VVFSNKGQIQQIMNDGKRYPDSRKGAKMKHRPMLLTVFAISLLLFALWNSTGAVEDPIVAAGAIEFNKGTVAPEFFIENLAGDRVKLEDFRGKVVLLDFWATW
jgi:hypothetical protein